MKYGIKLSKILRILVFNCIKMKKKKDISFLNVGIWDKMDWVSVLDISYYVVF